ncbi:MAG: peptidoglycan editing factor PgeF [Clostridia bacterium]|nr:peptidoglycan editing factor PgeF [Clostridia bacterium]
MIFNSNTMQLHFKDALAYLTFNRLSELDNIKHAFSTRLGGVSTGEFTSLNMSFGRGDSDENVTENYKRLCSALDIRYEDLVASAQDHNTTVRRVGQAQKGIGIYKPKDMLSVDGLITNEKGVALVTYFADCTPVLLVDTKRNAIGACHAGWRGTVSRIAQITVQSMTKEFGTDPQDIIAAVGPAIGKCCYEVDTPVAQRFIDLQLHESVVQDKGSGKYMVDLLLTNKQILMQAGVPESSIICSDVCTKCNCDLIWSHRATGGKRGGMCAILEIV